MTTNLLTLTASDLRGCDPFLVYLRPNMEFQFSSVEKDIIRVASFRSGSLEYAKEIQCHPSDYIRAWLGPMTARQPWATRAKAVIADSGCGVFMTSEDAAYIPLMPIVCPAALASAMGSSVWKRNNETWEPVE